MRNLISAVAAVLLVTPAVAQPVELVCNGELSWFGENYGSSPVKGIHVVVREKQVEVSGISLYSAYYAIDPVKSDAALIVFDYGLWKGNINRYSGELGLFKCSTSECKAFDNVISATCGKADPLF